MSGTVRCHTPMPLHWLALLPSSQLLHRRCLSFSVSFFFFFTWLVDGLGGLYRRDIVPITRLRPVIGGINFHNWRFFAPLFFLCRAAQYRKDSHCATFFHCRLTVRLIALESKWWHCHQDIVLFFSIFCASKPTVFFFVTSAASAKITLLAGNPSNVCKWNSGLSAFYWLSCSDTHTQCEYVLPQKKNAFTRMGAQVNWHATGRAFHGAGRFLNGKHIESYE